MTTTEIQVEVPGNISSLRRVGNTIYSVPATAIGLAGASLVRHAILDPEGNVHARKGDWVDGNCRVIPSAIAATYRRMRSIGIAA